MSSNRKIIKFPFSRDISFYQMTILRWKEMRHKIVPALTANRIKSMFPQMKQVCYEFNDYVRAHLYEDIEITKVSCFITCEMVAKCAFSVNGNSFDDKKAEFVKAGRKLWDTSIYSPLFMMITYFPFFHKLTRRKFISDDIKQLFVSLITQAIKLREHDPKYDYLQYLINLQVKDKGFKFKDVVAQSLTFFFDGFETSSLIISFAVYELALNLDLQTKLRNEIISVDFTYENINSLPLLDRVVEETFRMYSEFSLIRTCTKDTVLHSKGYQYPVLKGQEICIPMYAIHRDPEIYPDPDKFDPDRFLPENEATRHSLTKLAFGAGPRTCIGKTFAKCQIKVTLANIFANYQVIKSEKTTQRPRFCLQYLLPVYDKGLWVKFQLL